MSGLFSKLFSKNKQHLALSDVLKSLPSGYEVFESIIYNRTEIKAAVFHKSKGVVVINTCDEKGIVTFDGTTLFIKKKPRSELITKTLQDIFWLKSTIREKSTIDVAIHPIIAFTLADVRVSQPVVGVKLLSITDVVEAITSLPTIHDGYPNGVLVTLRQLHGTYNVLKIRDERI